MTKALDHWTVESMAENANRTTAKLSKRVEAVEAAVQEMQRRLQVLEASVNILSDWANAPDHEDDYNNFME